MDIKEEFMMALFNKSVREKASQMFQTNFDFNGFNNRMPLELFDISFRLYKPTSRYVNLEFLASSSIGKYFQPIGFYEEDNSVWILNEFVEAYNRLISNGQLTDKPKFADKKTNAVIAAFSMRTIEFASKTLNDFKENGWEPEFRDGIMMPAMMRYDKRFECNGYNCELLFSMEGYPQFYLDDKHELDGAVGAYIQSSDGTLSIHPTLEYKQLFDILNKFRLLTAFTKI
jgi:hypothetical protein